VSVAPTVQPTLRLALTVAVVQGFAHLCGMADSFYASLAVLSVTVGSYGDTLELGRQRLIGTLVGGIVVLIAYPALSPMPVMVGLPIAMVLARVLAGSLKLTVGYTVCQFVVVMGWLQHENQLDTWIPLRLFWTAFGVLVALLALRLFWPSRARIIQREGLLALLLEGAEAIDGHLRGDGAAGAQPTLGHLRDQLLQLRSQRAGALQELGSLAARHPSARIWAALDEQCETLLLVLERLERLRHPIWRRAELQPLAVQLTERMELVRERLRLWHHTFTGSPLRIPGPPLPAWQPLNLTTLASDDAVKALPFEQQQWLANRLVLLNQLDRSLQDTESRWLEALSSNR